MKQCSICGQSKPKDDFYKDNGKCKKCFSLEGALRKRGEYLPERFCVRCCEVKTQEYFPIKGKTLRQWCRDCDSPEGYDWCFVCFEHKPLEEFNHGASGRKCQDCRRTYQKNYDWYRHYGLLPEEYERRVKAQDGRCWICAEEKELVVDHNHSLGANIRALLCKECNLGLGYFMDNPKLLETAVVYLETFGSANNYSPQIPTE